MSEDGQTPLFPAETFPTESTITIRADASIQAALGAFEQHMEEEGFSIHTRRAFTSDIRLLGKYLGSGQPIGEIGTDNLNDFLNWLVNERGVPCSRKSYARRVTTLKVFFAWLFEQGILLSNPADAVIQISVTSPLPEIPTEAEINSALGVSEKIRLGDNDNQADARPHMLLTLLLQTGIKKSEALTIVPNHIDRESTDSPYLFVRYTNPRLRYKERKITLLPSWIEILDEYLEQYNPDDTLFTCTARNLEYILSDAGNAAGLSQGRLSFENLRWVSALRDYIDGVEPDEIRLRLGLSKITWRETKSKLEKLKERQARG